MRTPIIVILFALFLSGAMARADYAPPSDPAFSQIDERLYLGRDTRLKYLPKGTNAGLLSIWGGDQPSADMALDRILVSQWMAAKGGLTPEMVRDAMPEMIKEFFGREMSVSQAYDQIVEDARKHREGMDRLATYRKAQEEAKNVPVEPMQVEPPTRDREKYPGWQTPRALASGLFQYVQSIPAGLASFGASMTSYGVPVKFDPSQEAEAMAIYSRFATLRDERVTNSILKGTTLPVTTEEAELEAQVWGIAHTASDENRKALEEWERGPGLLSSALSASAKYWRAKSQQSDELMGVDSAFANSSYGQFVKRILITLLPLVMLTLVVVQRLRLHRRT